MQLKYFFAFYLLYILIPITAHSQITISGYVTDETNGEKLVGAVIHDSTESEYTITNNYGFFNLKVKKGHHTLKTSYVGFQKQSTEGAFLNDSILTISLKPNSSIEEVVITSENQNRFISSSDPGLVRMPMEMIQKLPSTLGETDILKSVQQLPGVQPGSEGGTGFYVRGGGFDNNLILLDGIEVFNPDHLFGFFSFFNDDAIKSVKFYKAGFPSQYNGRAASVLDIRTKDGNEHKLKGKATLGLLSSKLQFEGPLIKNKLTFIGSVRRTYLDLFSKWLIQNFTDYSEAGYYFYDLNGKIRWKINQRNSLYISNYFGKDDGYFQTNNIYGENPPLQNDFYNQSDRNKSITWGSNLLTLRFERIITPSLFMNVAVGMSNYDYLGKEINDETYMYWENNNMITSNYLSSLTTRSNIKMQVYAVDFNHSINKVHHFTYGGNFKQYNLRPFLDSTFLTKSKEGLSFQSQQMTFFFQDEIIPTDRITIIPGINFSSYFIGETSYYKLDKRLLLNFRVNEKLGIHGSWSEMTQHLHLLRLGTINLASDLWLPTTNSIKPTFSSDYSIGFKLNLNDAFTLGLDAYARTYRNLLYYREGLDFKSQYNELSEILTSGKGDAKGLELSIEKYSGRLTGLCSYNYSVAERTVPAINQGETFRAQYDRPHNLNVLLNYHLKNNWSFSSGFHIMSGSLQTLPIDKYNSNFYFGANPWSGRRVWGWGSEIIVYKRNSLRLPLYHRLDISANYNLKKQNFSHKISVGLHNAYNSKNAYEMQIQLLNATSSDESRIHLVKKVLFPIIPFINYSVEIE